MDLKLKDKDTLIEGVALPTSLLISLQKRGRTVVNHRYVEGKKVEDKGQEKIINLG